MSAPPAAADGSAKAFALTAAADGRLSAEGPLTFATAREARARGAQALAGAAAGALEIDCSGVTAGDSAGLAVLLEWLSLAQRSGRRLRYTHLPQGLMALARISEVEDLLGRGV
jgi:phospholipid transport system transporter-binding protein